MPSQAGHDPHNCCSCSSSVQGSCPLTCDWGHKSRCLLGEFETNSGETFQLLDCQPQEIKVYHYHHHHSQNFFLFHSFTCDSSKSPSSTSSWWACFSMISKRCDWQAIGLASASAISEWMAKSPITNQVIVTFAKIIIIIIMDTN